MSKIEFYLILRTVSIILFITIFAFFKKTAKPLNFNIVTEYPLWFTIFCLMLGVVYAFFLYHKDRKSDFSLWLRRVMVAFRFITVSIIAFLLLSPLFKTVFRYVEKPVVIVAQDNSQSIVTGKDSLFYKNEYQENLKEFIEKLGKDYKVNTYTFGDIVSTQAQDTFTEKQTDISELFDEIQTRYSNRNVGAIVLASDGIYNKGLNPLYASKKNKFPIYTIALGDTNVQRDVIVSKVNYNKIAYLGNKFPIEILIKANKCKGSTSKLIVSKGGQSLFTQNINFTSDNFTQTITLTLEAKESGLQHYRVSITPLKDEVSTSNNYQSIFIDVLDGKQKVLILAAAPHPDVSALKQAIESNYNYAVDAFLLDDFDKQVSAYNLVILHQLPSAKNPASQVFTSIRKTNVPALYIIGAQSGLKYFNNQKAGLTISEGKQSLNEALPSYNDKFNQFTLDNEMLRTITQFPPLMSPFGKYNIQNSINTLFYQKIGNVTTQQPLVLFNQVGDVRTGIIVGEGIWKWRLSCYAQRNSHDVFNELINKMVQYLSIKVDKSLFRIISKNNYYENEPVEFDAEVYNDSYELINDPEINMVITNSENKKFPFVFTKTANAYQLNAGTFPPGIYKYRAVVKVGEKLLEKTGEFSVTALNIETTNTIADHQLLYNLSKQHDGDIFYPNQLDELLQTLKAREDIKTISYTQKRFSEMINLRWVCFLIIFLLAVEWFLRKRAGAY